MRGVQQRPPGLRRDLVQVALDDADFLAELGEGLAGGDEAQAGRLPGQAAQERFQPRIAQLAAVHPLRGLERLHAVE